MLDEQIRYNEWLFRRVHEAVSEGAQSLSAIVARCEGADPIVVRDVLSTMMPDGWSDPGFTAPDQLNSEQDDGAVEPSLPIPHPLDYDWRFSRRGVAFILERAARLTKGSVLLLGATTVAIAAARRGWPGSIIAVDQSATIVTAARSLDLPLPAEFIAADVAHGEIQRASAEVVVMDPPWYPEHARPFFWAAGAACAPGGHVIAILPGEGTRPGIRCELDELLAWCNSTGLQLVDVLPQSVAYETPLFERNVSAVIQ